ncbi:MAG: RnfABCDGE type electron transport complex subunit D [Candidatus Riflebacteria bacterium]|nr:RnfABCDGE type electron transport complex subunit D [Candidatus Riflebacteria bacterium]
MNHISASGEFEKRPDRSDLFLCLFLLPLYFFIWGRFGQKFAAGALISLSTGAGCWLLALIFKSAGPSANSATDRFGWGLFLLFPLFCPLALPLWLIPIILIAAYLLTYSSFGGCGRHIFNPVAVAVVFMLVGYGHTASLHPVRPLPGPYDGFKVWNAGMPSAKPVWETYAEVGPEFLVEASYSGLLPALPGSAFGLPLLAASAALALLGRRRRVWWVVAVLSVQLATLLVAGWSDLDISALHPLLLGIVPGLLLIAVFDEVSLPEDLVGQVISALLFSSLAIVFIFRSENLLGPVYALLLAQITAPLLTDLLMRRGIN